MNKKTTKNLSKSQESFNIPLHLNSMFLFCWVLNLAAMAYQRQQILSKTIPLKILVDKCCEINLDRNHTNEKQRCVEQKIMVILGLSVFKQQHTQELKQWHKILAKHKDKQA